MDLCVNCGIATHNRCNATGRRLLNDAAILSVIRQWRSPQLVNSNDIICQACWDLAQGSNIEVPNVGHRNVCLRCGRSLSSRESHLLHTGSTREQRIYNVIEEWIIPRTVEATSHICHACWVAADRAAIRMLSRPSTSSQVPEPVPEVSEPVIEVSDLVPEASESVPGVQHQVVLAESPSSNHPEPTIILPDYLRSTGTERRCFIEGCRRTERNRVPLFTRKMLLNQYKYYVPENNRLCDQHYVIESWDFLESIRNNYVQTFTAKHIQDMLKLKEEVLYSGLVFENIEEMPDHLVHRWLGKTKAQYSAILEEVPQLLEFPRGGVALAAYLMKLKTGESNERISDLFKVSRTTIEKWLTKVRSILTNNFVPNNLGLNNLTREQIIERNLLIPKTLFGHFQGNETPIAIFDGTYCYIEKSSNYLYQKKTYSLHKYRNLLKPFMVVCTDGYIIDVLGPYPASTSDSDIMKDIFLSGRPLRDFFNPSDAFILDRGFRDSLPLLSQYGYRTYVPATLKENETQLCTKDANESREVTLCRWVVEVVNGRFKRDYKLLKDTYFNVASKNLMTDFRVAAALINRFHPVIVDRVDADQIIQQINININRENDLADFVIHHHYNRRRADFITMTVHNENLNDFPQLTESELILVSLGTYQIKQARSYYGEHVRGNDGFVIEVCRDISSTLRRELSASNTSWMLRGRIKSRHISRKTYFIYILVDSSRRGRDAILKYCCNCIVGRRTVGCCAHVMTIIWYLSWARYQPEIVPPALFLDDILLIIEEENN